MWDITVGPEIFAGVGAVLNHVHRYRPQELHDVSYVIFVLVVRGPGMRVEQKITGGQFERLKNRANGTSARRYQALKYLVSTTQRQ